MVKRVQGVPDLVHGIVVNPTESWVSMGRLILSTGSLS
jgi:hypothetical protein